MYCLLRTSRSIINGETSLSNSCHMTDTKDDSIRIVGILGVRWGRQIHPLSHLELYILCNHRTNGVWNAISSKNLKRSTLLLNVQVLLQKTAYTFGKKVRTFTKKNVVFQSACSFWRFETDDILNKSQDSMGSNDLF